MLKKRLEMMKKFKEITKNEIEIEKCKEDYDCTLELLLMYKDIDKQVEEIIKKLEANNDTTINEK